jgi:hypothetical protein
LFASTLNTDLDSQTIFSQQLAENINRTVTVPITDASTLNMQLPSSTVRANKLFAFGADGSPQASTNTLAAIDAAVDTIESIAAASSGSSASISHIASGTGAVATTVQAKLRETVSVKDFGAVGDGVTDDTTAIQNAFTACAEGGTVYFGAGETYLVGSITSRTANVVDLNGSTIVRKAPFSSGNLLTLQPTQKNQYTGLSISVATNQNYFTLPSGASVEIDDLHLFTSPDTSTPYTTNYLHGQYAIVSNIVEIAVTLILFAKVARLLKNGYSKYFRGTLLVVTVISLCEYIGFQKKNDKPSALIVESSVRVV